MDGWVHCHRLKRMRELAVGWERRRIITAAVVAADADAPSLIKQVNMAETHWDDYDRLVLYDTAIICVSGVVEWHNRGIWNGRPT